MKKFRGISFPIDLQGSISYDRREQSIRPRSFLRPEMVSPRLEVPRHIPRPSYVGAAEVPEVAEEFQFQNEAGVLGMRAAGRLAALIRDFVGTLVRVRIINVSRCQDN